MGLRLNSEWLRQRVGIAVSADPAILALPVMAIAARALAAPTEGTTMRRFSKTSGLFLVIALVMLHGMIAEHAVEAWHSFEKGGFRAPADWHLVLVIAASCGMFAGATVLLWQLRKLVLHSSAEVVKSDEAGDADGALILLLSPPSFGKERSHEDAMELFMTIDRSETPSKTAWDEALSTVTKSYSRGNKSPFTLWNWQQQLRIIADEMARATVEKPLHEIIVITTNDSVDHEGKTVAGSLHSFAAFKAMVDALFVGWPAGGAPIVREADSHLQIGDYEHSYMVCRRAIEQAQKHTGRTVCFDITGGITESSVAAAIATLNRDVRFSYVNTNSTKPLFYNATVSVMPGGE